MHSLQDSGCFTLSKNQKLYGRWYPVGKTHGFVRKWNLRVCDQLSGWEISSSEKIKRQKLLEVFSDLPRTSGPKTYTAEQQCHVMATALKKPSECQREITHWTHIELADELNKTELVKGISKSTVGRLLRQVDIRPHKIDIGSPQILKMKKNFTKK